MTRSALSRKILSLHRKGEPLNIHSLKRNHPDLLEVAYSFTPFLGWKQALEAAGLDYRSIKIELEPYVECRICGEPYIILPNHLRFKHGIDTVEYRQEFPDAEVFSETRRFNSIKPNTGGIPHWEPILSMEYVKDRVWHWYSIFGRYHVEFICSNDKSLIGYVRKVRENWESMLHSMGLDAGVSRKKLRGKDYSLDLDDVVSKLLAHRKAGFEITLPALMAEAPGLLHEIIDGFGSLARALDACSAIGDSGTETGGGASLAAKRKKKTSPTPVRGKRALAGAYPDVESVINALRERHREGLSINQVYVLLEEPTLKSAAFYRCGSWINAIRLAGLQDAHREARESVVRKDAVYPSGKAVITALKRRVEQEKSLFLDHVNREDRPLKTAAFRYFGSWLDAVRAAGLSKKLERAKHAARAERRANAKFPTRRSILDALKDRARSGKSILANNVASEDGSLRDRVFEKFNSWEEAIRAAGLWHTYSRNPRAVTRYPDADSVIAALRLRASLGLRTGSSIVGKEDPPLKCAIYRIFGNWGDAVRAAGLAPERVLLKDRYPDSASMLEALKNRVRNGLSIVSNDVSRDDQGLRNLLCGTFGDWENAIRAAGLWEVYSDDVRAARNSRYLNAEAVLASGIGKPAACHFPSDAC